MAFICLFTNAASANTGSLSAGYASDYFREGAMIAGESVTAGVDYSISAGDSLELSLGAATNQSVSSGSDAYLISLGASKQWSDLIGTYIGEHFELVSGDAALDVELKVDVSVPLNPSLSVARNTDETLYTVEVGVSHSLELEIVNLDLSASYGNADVSTVSDIDYWTLGASASKSVSENSDLALDYDYVDSDLVDGESIVGVSLTVSF